MSKKQSEPTNKEFAESVKATILKPRKNPPKYENREPSQEELSRQYRLERRHK